MFEVTMPRVTVGRGSARFADEMAHLHYTAARFGPEIAAAGHAEREWYWLAEAARLRAAEDAAWHLRLAGDDWP